MERTIIYEAMKVFSSHLLTLWYFGCIFVINKHKTADLKKYMWIINTVLIIFIMLHGTNLVLAIMNLVMSLRIFDVI